MVGKGALSRRRLIAVLLLVPPAVAGCSFGPAKEATPDPLIALADAARADAALAAAAAADPQLAGRVAPLRWTPRSPASTPPGPARPRFRHRPPCRPAASR